MYIIRIVHAFCFNIKFYVLIVFIFLIHVAMYMEILHISFDNIIISYFVELLQNSMYVLS
jgi:hypothetical protein